MKMRSATYALAAWFVTVGLVWLGPALWGYAMHITDHDTALQYYPYLDFFAAALQSGQSFLWMPGIFSGFPIYLSQSGGFFDPVNIAIFSFFDGISGTHLRLFLDYVATCFFSYVAGRAFGVSRMASALVGPSFLISYHMRFLSNPIIANTLFLTPLLLFVAQRLLDTRMRARVAIPLISIGLGISFLSGYTQMIVYALLAVGCYVIIFLGIRWQEIELATLFRQGIIFSAGIVGGIIIGLPFILPAANFLTMSARSESPTYAQSTLKSVEFGDVALFMIPDHMYIPYVTAGKKPLYVGTLWFLFALAAITYACNCLRRVDRRVREHAQLISLSAVFLLFLAISLEHSPLFYVLNSLPILEQFRFPYRFMYVGVFFLALLGAIGFDQLQTFISKRYTRFVLWAGVVGATGVAALIAVINMLSVSSGEALMGKLHAVATFFNAYEALGLTKGPDHYSAALLRAVEAARELLSFGEVFVLIPFSILVASVALMALFLLDRVSWEVYKKFALGISVVTVLAIPMLRYQYFFPVSEVGKEDHLAIAFADESDRELFRMYSFIPSAAIGEAIPPQFKLSFEEEVVVKKVSTLAGVPNYHLYHDLASIDGYDQFESMDTLAAVELVGGMLFAGYGSGTNSERTERLLENLDVLAMMGGKYIISGVELSSKSLTLRSETRHTDYNIRLFVYEQEARPRYYVATDAVNRPHSGFRDLIKEGVPPFEAQTYIDCVDCARLARGVVQLVQSRNGFYELDVELETDGQVVLTESFIPGWVATIDGVDADIVRANGLYMALSVPAGYHRITFEYQGLMNELRILKMLHLVE